MKEVILTLKNRKKRKAEELVRAGNYEEINFVIAEGIKRKRFSVEDQTIGEYQIILVEIEQDLDSSEVLTWASSARLERPAYADAFLLGEQHPDEQKAGPIIILHDAYCWSGHFFNLVLKTDKSGRRILSLLSIAGRWAKGTRFAFVRQMKKER
jgi:hypothetical protein